MFFRPPLGFRAMASSIVARRLVNGPIKTSIPAIGSYSTKIGGPLLSNSIIQTTRSNSSWKGCNSESITECKGRRYSSRAILMPSNISEPISAQRIFLAKPRLPGRLGVCNKTKISGISVHSLRAVPRRNLTCTFAAAFHTYSSRANDTNNTKSSNEKTNDKNMSSLRNTEPQPKVAQPKTTQPKTKAEYLAAASGVFERVYIRLKLLLLKQVRPFNSDDFSAFFSWILVGNILWVILGTTTFFSLVVLTLNTVYAQDYVAAAIGKMVTKETGIKVVFEHAIVPHWRDGVISFRKVFVSRRPGLQKGSRSNVQQGSQAVAMASAAALQQTKDLEETEADDGNYTQFDFTIESVSVTLSFRRWIDGKGILKDVEVKGLRGVVDRRHVKWKNNDDAAKYKNQHRNGDFELESFKMEDVMFTLQQPGEDKKPFDVSIFNCELPQLRKHWLFYDFLSANNISGSYDNSLFTIHRRQMPQAEVAGDGESKSPWKRVSRLRIDNVDVKHLNSGVQGPFGWIESGNVDMLADVMLPTDEDLKLSEVVQDIVERWEASLSHRMHRSRQRNPDKMTSANQSSSSSESSDSSISEVVTSVEEKARERQSHKYVVINLRVQLNNTRAAVPLFNSDLTYINNALIRPIVAYINSRDTYIPINCRVVKKLGDFEGSWTVYDSHLMDDVSAEVYEAFVRNISDEEERARRIRKVSFWSLQLAAQVFLLSLGIMI